MLDQTNDAQPPLPGVTLDNLPMLPGLPVLGHTYQFLSDPYGYNKRCRETLGPVYRSKVFGLWRASLNGPDAIEFVLTDKDRIFSSAQGWSVTLGDIFPGGLMMRDFDDHRQHRRIMQAAFRSEAMAHYQARMAAEMPGLIAQLPKGHPFDFYTAIKNLTLRLGAAVFMGLEVDDPDAAALNTAFINELAAVSSPIRSALPFTPKARGLTSRRFLVGYLRDLIAKRRDSTGQDFFSQMCRARDEDGTAWSDAEIVDHFNFLLMAAHDTTASGLTALIWGLGTHPEWQDRIAQEVAALPDGPLDKPALDSMEITDWAFKEALRLLPPVIVLSRRALRNFEWGGFDFPAGAHISAMIGPTMVSPEIYTDPERFDPGRFAPDRAEHKSHRFAFVPYGGGAHKCIGLHFSILQVKLFIAELNRHGTLRLIDGQNVRWSRLPIPRPKGGMKVILDAR